MKASEVLMKARALIDKPWKWEQYGGASSRPDGASGHCMVTALNYVYDYGDENAEPYLLLAVGGRRIHLWNDAPERTHADVMQAFDRAIALALADERKDAPWTMEDTKRVIDGIVSGQHQHTLDELNA